MTASEKSELQEMRKELSAYHLEVHECIARFEATDGAVVVLQADVYGVPGERNDHPGLMGEVADLKRSRRTLRFGLRGVWAVLTIAGGAVIAKFFRG